MRLQVAGCGLRRAVGLHWRRRGGAARGSRAALGVGAALISAAVVGGLSSSAVALGAGVERQWWALVVGVGGVWTRVSATARPRGGLAKR